MASRPACFTPGVSDPVSIIQGVLGFLIGSVGPRSTTKYVKSLYELRNSPSIYLYQVTLSTCDVTQGSGCAGDAANELSGCQETLQLSCEWLHMTSWLGSSLYSAVSNRSDLTRLSNEQIFVSDTQK
jgi:hypothetical protein